MQKHIVTEINLVTVDKIPNTMINLKIIFLWLFFLFLWLNLSYSSFIALILVPVFIPFLMANWFIWTISNLIKIKSLLSLASFNWYVTACKIWWNPHYLNNTNYSLNLKITKTDKIAEAWKRNWNMGNNLPSW